MNDKLHVTVDLEFFEDTMAYRSCSQRGLHGLGKIGVENLLDLFERYEVESTFFTVSRIAEEYPDLIRKIESYGHEIASHSASHQVLDDDKLLEEAEKSKEIIGDLTKGEVVGYRAPAFNIEPKTVSELSSIGYKYDSSLIPSLKLPGWYGGKKTDDSLEEELKGYELNEMLEIPPSVNPYLRFPISGFWMRLFGIKYTIWSIRSLVDRGVSPVLYLHPWELVDLPRIKGIPRRVYLRTGEKTLNYLEEILKLSYDKNSLSETI